MKYTEHHCVHLLATNELMHGTMCNSIMNNLDSTINIQCFDNRFLQLHLQIQITNKGNLNLTLSYIFIEKVCVNKALPKHTLKAPESRRKLSLVL